MPNKPKLLFFEDDYSGVLPHLQIGYVQFFHRMMEAHFELELVSWNCDYAEEVDRVQPELVVFDGNFMNGAAALELNIRNIPQIVDVPRVGLIRHDAGGPGVLRAIERLERFGVEPFFSSSMSSLCSGASLAMTGTRLAKASSTASGIPSDSDGETSKSKS